MNIDEQKTAAKILAEYEALVKLKIAQKLPHKDVQPMTPGDIMFLRALLHPTKRAESQQMTRQLLEFIYEHKIVIADDIYQAFNWSDKPVMKRLKLLKEFGVVKRISKKYYLATPRLETIITRYLDRLCK